MLPSVSRGTIAQALGFLSWAAFITGHSPVSEILKDPNLATEATTFIGLAFTLWGVAEHVYAAYTAKAVVAPMPMPPKSLTE
jgi:hypothetical protein